MLFCFVFGAGGSAPPCLWERLRYCGFSQPPMPAFSNLLCLHGPLKMGCSVSCQQFEASLYLGLPTRFPFSRLSAASVGDPGGRGACAQLSPGEGGTPFCHSHSARIKGASSGSREVPHPIAPPVSKEPGPLKAFEAWCFRPRGMQNIAF